MNKAKIITALVDKFLSWPLPKDFAPDGGITFDRRVNGKEREGIWWPIGTNLLTATQARQMLEYLLGDQLESLRAEETSAEPVAWMLRFEDGSWYWSECDDGPCLFPSEEEADRYAEGLEVPTESWPLYAAPPPPAIPEDYVLVPKEPTKEMIEAGFGPFLGAHDRMFVRNEPCGPIYKAMLTAATKPDLPNAQAIRNAALEEAAKACEGHQNPLEFSDASIQARLMAETIRALKSLPATQEDKT